MGEADPKDIPDTLAASPSVRHGLGAGATFAGRYAIEDLIGLGGMGEVYRARDLQVGETIALKLLALGGRPQPVALERFRREVRLARRVTHRNVARTHDLGEHHGVYFLTMEYVEGDSLAVLLEERGTLPPHEAALVGAQIAHGLEAAHAAGVIHRDLKPGNVLVEIGDRVVITDFGIARTGQEAAVTLRSGQVLGTPGYMSPEQVLGEDVDERTDLYALGTILYESLTGRLPFEGTNGVAVALARVRQPPPDPRLRASVPDGLAELVLALLATRPADRPASAAEVAARLELLALGGGRHGGTTAPPTPNHSSVTSGSISSPFAPMLRGEPGLAVLPFGWRGPRDGDYLADGLSEDLIDVLSRTRGLRVLAMGATARYRDPQDPRALGATLGVDTIVAGTIQRAGDHLRIAARLLDVATGTQVWSERFETELNDVFEVQERMSRRIAEALRLELTTVSHRGDAPAEAIQLYLRAKSLLRTHLYTGTDGAVVHLERCLELAPAFAPAIAHHAIACMRAWWDERMDGGRDWTEAGRSSLARAMEAAPEMPETHLAAAILHNQLGEHADAARALQKVLEIAPTCADAHAMLGELQAEAGRLREGKRRLRLALELDPSLNQVRLVLARLSALEGDEAGQREWFSRIEENPTSAAMAITTLELRFAVWSGDEGRVERALDRIGDDTQMRQLLRVFGGYLRGEIDGARIDELEAGLASFIDNPRFLTLVSQLVGEAHAFLGDHDRALGAIERAAGRALCDVTWLDRCPVLAGVRDTPRFAEVRRRVHGRAAHFWQ